MRGQDHWGEKVPEREKERESWRGGGWRWSWSLFFCAAALDHLHQVDIRRVYSGVCNCILSPVLHCQPWKWNLINPDQFLMYKMNWQRFKKRELQFKSGEWYMYFFLSEILLAVRHPPTSQSAPAHCYHITMDLFFFQGKGRSHKGWGRVIGGVLTGGRGWIAQIYCSLSGGWTNWIDDLKQGRTISILLRSLYQKDWEPYFIHRTIG